MSPTRRLSQALSQQTDMYNTSSLRIAPSKEYTAFSDERFNEMNSCVFPCYPTAFVIARDVTLRFTSATSVSDSFAHSVEEHSSKGGGFFILGGSSSSQSNSDFISIFDFIKDFQKMLDDYNSTYHKQTLSL